MADRHFVTGGVTNNWSDILNWSLTAGGVGGQAVPTNADDVFLDASSPNCTVNSGASRVCRQFDCTGYTGTLTMSVGLTCGPQNGGVFKFGSGMSFAGSSAITIQATTAVTLTSAGVAITVPLIFNANPSATHTLADNWDVNAAFTHTSASNNTFNGNAFNCSSTFTITGSKVFGTTAFVLDGTGTWSGTGSFGAPLTINTAGTVTLSGTVRVEAASLTYTAGTVVVSGSTLSIESSMTFNCAGVTWNNISANTGGANQTFTLSADLNCSGNYVNFHSGAGVNTFNGNHFNIGGGINVSGGHVGNGTTEFVMTGTGTLQLNAGFGNTFRANLTINTAGTITISGTFHYYAGTFKYTAGTLAGTSTPILKITTGAATILDFNGATLPAALVISAGISLSLASGLVLSSLGMTLTGSGGANVVLKSTSNGVQRVFTVPAGAPMANRYVTVTDMDSSGGQRVQWRKPGTVTNTINWGEIAGSANTKGKGGSGSGVNHLSPAGAQTIAIGNPGLSVVTNT